MDHVGKHDDSFDDTAELLHLLDERVRLRGDPARRHELLLVRVRLSELLRRAAENE